MKHYSISLYNTPLSRCAHCTSFLQQSYNQDRRPLNVLQVRSSFFLIDSYDHIEAPTAPEVIRHTVMIKTEVVTLVMCRNDSNDNYAKMGPYSLLDLTIFQQLWPFLTTVQPDLTTRAQLHLTSIDAENTIIYCSKYYVLYAFMEQPLAGGGTASKWLFELPKNELPKKTGESQHT